MDTRTGTIYESKEAAVAAGVPAEMLAEVEPNQTRTTMTVTNGPFKGRVYDLVGGKRGRRRKDLEGR